MWFKRIALFCLASTGYAIIPPGVAPYTAVFPIDPGQRGIDLIATFNALSARPYFSPNSEVAIITTRNGFIPFVQSITQSAFNTILIITYRPTRTSTSAQNIYIAVPTEQIREMIYSNTTITGTNFTSLLPEDVLPYYPINLTQRALDIRSVVNTFRSIKPFDTGVEIINLHTTLAGPYYAPFSNGVIPDVQSITIPSGSAGTLMLVTYQINNLDRYIVVSPEQVFSIQYIPR